MTRTVPKAQARLVARTCLAGWSSTANHCHARTTRPHPTLRLLRLHHVEPASPRCRVLANPLRGLCLRTTARLQRTRVHSRGRVGASDRRSPQSAISCSDLACDGDLTISGRMAASSFWKAPCDRRCGCQCDLQHPGQRPTILVYPNGLVTHVVLPIAESAPGRIVRVKIMGAGRVDVQGSVVDPSMNVTDQIDGAPSYGLQGSTAALTHP